MSFHDHLVHHRFRVVFAAFVAVVMLVSSVSAVGAVPKHDRANGSAYDDSTSTKGNGKKSRESTPDPVEPTPDPIEEPSPEPAPDPIEEPAPEPAPEPTPEPIEEPDPEPEPEPTDPAPEPITGIRPVYGASSPWNTPIPADAPVHPDSDVFVDRFESAASTGVKRPLTSDPTQYTYPVYNVSEATPLRTIRLSGTYSNTIDETTTRRLSTPVLEVPIPLHAQPSPGTDASVVIWNPITGDEWGFWEFRNNGDGTFAARNGYHYNTRWSAVPPTSPDQFMSRGAGLPYFAGLVRRDEVDAGAINHALAFAYDYPSPEVTWPATKSDGWGTPGLDVPEGARIRLDPKLTEADFESWGLSREGKIIARALQRYGMYTIDQAGRPKVMIEDEKTAAWNGTITSSTVSAIPWSAFEVVDWRAPKPPVAVLPADAEVTAGSLVTLNGAASYDPDGAPLDTFEWTTPDGTVLSEAASSKPQWDTAGLAAGRYTFSLRVRDDSGTWSIAPATVSYTVTENSDSVAVLQQQSFEATFATGATGTTWRPLPGEEILTVVALRPARTTVESVTGNGLTWTRVLRHRDTQGELAVEVWRASGADPSSGPVNVTTSTEAWAINTHALRLSPSSVIAVSGADTGAVDTKSPSVPIDTPGGSAVTLGVHVGRATAFTPDAGLEELGRHVAGTGGNEVRMTVLRAPAGDAGVRSLGGTQSSALDWVMAGLVLEPR